MIADLIADLIDEATIVSIAEEAWQALVGDEEYLVGNVKAVLPGPSLLGLAEVGVAPAGGSPADVVRVDLLWRGAALTITVQGSAGAPPVLSELDPQENEVPL